MSILQHSSNVLSKNIRCDIDHVCRFCEEMFAQINSRLQSGNGNNADHVNPLMTKERGIKDERYYSLEMEYYLFFVDH